MKAVFVALTFAGHASLWVAIVADIGGALPVIFKPFRLLRTGSSESRVRDMKVEIKQPGGPPSSLRSGH